jgi:hypothetical protein
MESLINDAGSMSDFDAHILVEIGDTRYRVASLVSTDLIELASHLRDAGDSIEEAVNE